MANLRVDKITSTETFERTGSVQFDGNSDYLSIPSNVDLNPASSDFTLEMWVYPESYNPSDVSSGYNAIYVNADTNGLWIGTYQGSFIVRKYGVANVITHSSTPTPHKWTHIAVTRAGTSLRLFYDGVLQENATDSTAWVTAATYIATDAGGVFWHGFISNLRFIKGKALYTSNFKTPMKELEVTPETKLLCCQSKTSATLEKIGKVITANGTANASELTPGLLTPIAKSGGGSAIKGSVEFDGTNDYLSIADNTDLEFGSGDFTVEAFIYPTGIPQGTYACIFSKGFPLECYYVSTNSIGLYASTATSGSNNIISNANVTGTDSVSPNSWTHFVLCRSGDTWKVFINGIQKYSATHSGTIADSGQPFGIGDYSENPGTYEFQGNISNFRVLKGTALYTDNFIPPTRELKKIPNTVLLCCQDPDNPLTEATGKTITPYGSLGDGGLGPELVTNNDVWTLTKGGGGATDWTVSNAGRSLAGTTVSGGYIRATYTLSKGDYLVSLRWTGGAFAVQDSTGYIVATNGIDTEFSSSEDGAYSFYMTATTSVVITGTSWSTAYTVDDISIKRIYRNNGASNFTPQVGDDRKVTFEGVTKINSDAYFYLPTGDTVTRETRSGKAVFAGGYSPSGGTKSSFIESVKIPSTGNAQDFGDLKEAVSPTSASSATRQLIAGGYTGPLPTVNVDYLTIATSGNSLDFGSLSQKRRDHAGCANDTRVLFSGGTTTGSTTPTNTIEYMTTASTGSVHDFGTLISTGRAPGACASPTRGIFFGGYLAYASPISTYTNAINYVTISTTGNGQDFGDLVQDNNGQKHGQAAFCNSTRGVIGGGAVWGPDTPQYTYYDNIEYVTMSSFGNALDFGDLTQSVSYPSGTSNSTRGIFNQGFYNPSLGYINAIQYVTISTTGNTQDFGDAITGSFAYNNSASDSHGGLG